MSGGAEGLLGAKGFQAPQPLQWDEDGGGAASSGSGAAPSSSAAPAGDSGRANGPEASTSGRAGDDAGSRFTP